MFHIVLDGGESHPLSIEKKNNDFHFNTIPNSNKSVHMNALDLI